MDGIESNCLTEVLKNADKLTPELEELFYRLFRGRMMGVASRYLPDIVSAEEAVNDSFVKAFMILSDNEVDGEMSLVSIAWLKSILVTTIIDRLKGNSPFPEYDSVDIPEHVADVEIDGHLLPEDMLRLIQSLPGIQRLVFNLKKIDRYSHADIARMTGITASSSRGYLSGAAIELRSLYTRYYGSRSDQNQPDRKLIEGLRDSLSGFSHPYTGREWERFRRWCRKRHRKPSPFYLTLAGIAGSSVLMVFALARSLRFLNRRGGKSGNQNV